MSNGRLLRTLEAHRKPRAVGETSATAEAANVAESKSAVISACGTYRYLLSRHIKGGTGVRVVFVLLNPSTADAMKDDPTVRRCIGFAKRFKANCLDIVNVFGLRATDPKELRGHPDPVGPLNRSYMREAVAEANIVILGWGAMRPVLKAQIPHLLAELRIFRKGPVHCLGTTRTGSPKHPLYLPADAPLQIWRPQE